MFESLLTGNPGGAHHGLRPAGRGCRGGARTSARRPSGLNPKARFHNGTPVLAADVVHSFKTLISKRGRAAVQDHLRRGQGRRRRCRRAHRCASTLPRPTPNCRWWWAAWPVFSRAWGGRWQAQAFRPDRDRACPSAPGPYKLANAAHGRDITYARDPNYWGADLPVRKGFFNFDRVTYKIYLDETSQVRRPEGRRVRLHARIHSRATGRASTPASSSPRASSSSGPSRTRIRAISRATCSICASPSSRTSGCARPSAWRWTSSGSTGSCSTASTSGSKGYFPNSEFHAEGLPKPEELALAGAAAQQAPARRSSARSSSVAQHRPAGQPARKPAQGPGLADGSRLDLPRRRPAQCQGRGLRHRVPERPAGAWSAWSRRSRPRWKSSASPMTFRAVDFSLSQQTHGCLRL